MQQMYATLPLDSYCLRTRYPVVYPGRAGKALIADPTDQVTPHSNFRTTRTPRPARPRSRPITCIGK